MAEQMVTQDELFNGDPDLREDSTDSNTQGNSSYSFDSDMSYDDMLNVIMGRDDYISRPPSSESGFYVDPETGQAYTNYEAMSNEDRLAAWDAWYQEAEAYGYENLNANDKMLYIQNAYRLGYIDAATADEMWEPLHNEMMVANGWTLESDGTWRREREGGGGRTIIETAEAPTFSGGNYGESGAWDGSIQGEDTPGVFNENYANMNNQWNNYERTVEGASGLQGLFATVMSEVAPIVVKGTLAWATGQALNPMIISALGSAGITGSAATAIASAVSSQVANGFINGEMSLEGALAAGLSGYLSSGGLSDLIGEASGTFDELMNTVNQAMELGTGSEFIGAMVQAGATNVLIQYAATGEIDPLLLASSLATAGLVSELSDVVQQGFENGTITEDEFDAWLEEQEGLEQAFIDADIKDPFLNPNYTSVGEGLMVDADGNVFNYDGDNMGTMDELDTNNDGMLTGSDLQEVGDTAEFNQQYAPPETTTSPTVFTQEWADERYAGMSEAQIREQMARDGFNDEQIETYISTLPEIDTTTINHAGGWSEDTSQPYTLHYRDGQHYVVSNGYLKAITEEQYTDLYADLQNGTASFDSLDQYGVGYPGLSGGGEVVTGVNPITKEGSFDPQSDWISLDPSEEQVGGQIEFTEEPIEPEPVEPEPVEPENVQETAPEPDPTESTAEPIGGAVSAPSTPASGVSAELEQLQEQYQQAMSQGDYITANIILAQIEQLQQEQSAVEEVVDVFEDTASAIENADGTLPQDTTPEKPENAVITGVETEQEPTTEDTRTEWQINRDYIIAQVEAGTATEGQQAWYDSWVEAGSPDTQEGMTQGDAADATTGTAEPGAGGTGPKDYELGGGGDTDGTSVGEEPEGPESPAGGPSKPSVTFGPGASTGDPGIGDEGGPGGGGGGGAGRGGMMTGGFKPAPFQPFRTGISYTAPAIASIITPPQKDYVRELDSLTARLSKGLFEGLV